MSTADVILAKTQHEKTVNKTRKHTACSKPYLTVHTRLTAQLSVEVQSVAVGGDFFL